MLMQLLNVNPATIGETEVNAIDARELYERLGVGDDFSTWFKRRVEKYGFTEGYDFSAELRKSSGGRPSTEYAISIDMAKELAMVENNKTGQKIRRYLIEVEKQSRQQAVPQLPDFTNPAIAARAWADQVEITQKQAAQIEADAPKIEAHDRLVKADGLLNIQTAGKELGVGPNKFAKYLRINGYIYKRAGGSNNLAYQRYIEQGLFEHKTTIIKRPDGSDKVCDQVFITAKGMVYFAKKLGSCDLFSAKGAAA